MGSDLYMEAQSFRPRANKAEWDGDYLVIYKDVSFTGWSEIWRGKPDLTNDQVRSLILTMIKKIPEKPVTLEDQLSDILREHFLSQLTTKQAVNKIRKLLDS